MSARRDVTIFCDGQDVDGSSCGAWEMTHSTQRTAAEIRAELKAAGWSVALPGGRDLCPSCREQA